MTLAEMKEQLASLEAVQASGVQEYTIVGSHSVVNVNSQNLSKQIANLKRRIYRFQGHTGRTTPDFSTGQSNAKDY